MKFSPLFVALSSAFAVFATQAATYQVVELSPVDGYKNSFPSAINDANQIVGNLTNRYNYPVDLSAVDFTSTIITDSLTAAEIEEVKKGNINSKAQGVLNNYLQQNALDYKVQRFANVYSARLDTRELLNLRETAAVKTNDEYLVDVSDNSEFVGYATAPFTKQSFTPAATETTPNPEMQQLWVPEATHFAGVVVSTKGRVILPPLYTELGGGFSIARGINNTGKVIGSASVGMSDANKETLNTSCTGLTQPKAICYHLYGTAVYQTSAVTWQLGADGQPEPAQKLGYLGDKNTGKPHTRTDYPVVDYVSVANDVNDSGIVVGQSTYSNSDEIRTVYVGYVAQDVVLNSTHATIFANNEVKSIIDPLEWVNSDARAINNKGVVVGYASKIVNNAAAPRLFVYDYNSQKLSFPNALFDSANTVPEAINDNGIVVGLSQNYLTGYAKPRQVGFLYDTANGSFKDLNTLVSCNNPYRIVQALDINNKNVIVASAVKEVEQRDVKGDIVKDSAGNAIKEEIAVAVQLIPIANGNVDDCSKPAEATYERKGGSSTLGLLLLPLVWLRRRQHH